MSLPHASQQQIDAMNRIAAEKMAKDGVVEQPIAADPVQEVIQEPEYQAQEESVEDTQDIQGVDQEGHIEDVAQAAPVESSKEHNLRFLRERAEKAEREREELMRYMMNMQQQQQPVQKQVQPQEPEEFSLAIDDESLMEGKHGKQMAQKIALLEKKLNNYEQQIKKNDQQTIEMRLQNQYPDFNKVVTQDNLVRLRQINPDLADTILANNDQFKQAKLAYDMVKQYGIYQNQETIVEQALAKRNINKPRPLTSISPTQSDSPISKVNAFANAPLSKEVKQSLYEEMLQSMKGL